MKQYRAWYSGDNPLLLFEMVYVPDDELVRLGLITFEERRATNIDFDLLMDVRKYGWKGVFKMNKEEREEHTWFGLYLWEGRKAKRK